MSEERAAGRLPAIGLGLVAVPFLALLEMSAGDGAVTAIAVVGALSAALQGRIPIPPRGLLPIAVVLSASFMVAPTYRPFQSEFIGPGSFHVSLFLALGVCVLLLRRPDLYGRYALVSASTAMMMSCGMRTRGDLPFGLLVALHAFCLALYLRLLRQPFPRRSWLPAALCFLPLTGLATAIVVFLHWTETRLDLFTGLFEPAVPISVNFANQSRLSGMLSSASSDTVALRVFSKRPPERLVARRYATYRKDVWETSNQGAQPMPLVQERLYDLPTYGLAPLDGPLLQVDRIELASPSGGQLVAPLDTRLLAAPVDRLGRDGAGTLVVPKDVAFSGDYYVGRGEPVADMTEDKAYLQLPDDLPPVVGRLAREVAGSQPTPRLKAQALELYLQTRFTYGFDYPFKPRPSPLQQFLEDRPPAHCEFFATSMVTMLRSQGIPARYVAGFLVDSNDWSSMGGYYAVRARYAHAWVEAFLPGEGWVTFDPTPRDGRLPQRSRFGRWMLQLLDIASYQWSRFVKFLGLSPREMLARIQAALKEALAWLASHPLALLAVLLAALAVQRLGRLRWLRRARRSRAAQDEDGPLPACLARFERSLAPHGLERPPQGTLLEWAAELHGPGDVTRCGREFLETYCRIRYGRAPEQERLEALLAELEGLRVAARRQSSPVS